MPNKLKRETSPDGTKPHRDANSQGYPRAATAKRRMRQAPADGAPLGAHETILRAAEQEFAMEGYGGARADRIAARAGVNRALPFYYFGSKANLYDEVMTRAFRKLSEIPLHTMGSSGQLPPVERLRRFVRGMLELAAGDADWMRLIMREIIDDGTRAQEFARTHLAPVVEVARGNMEREFQAVGITDLDPVQVIVSLLCEAFFYFVFAPALEGIGLEGPFSQASLDAREEAIVALIIRTLRGSVSI